MEDLDPLVWGDFPTEEPPPPGLAKALFWLATRLREGEKLRISALDPREMGAAYVSFATGHVFHQLLLDPQLLAASVDADAYVAREISRKLEQVREAKSRWTAPAY